MTVAAATEARTLRRILVIKHGALGDIVLALGPFAAFRRHHADAHITLLTTAPFVEFLSASPYFDEIWADPRPSPLDVPGWLALRRRLRGGRFDRVYDLQTSDRTAAYFRLFGLGQRPEWSGIARGCSHPHEGPARLTAHSIDRQKAQLALAGIDNVPDTDLSWATADISRFDLAGWFALLVPGGSAHRPAKRWPVDNYAALATDMARRGLQPVIVGGTAERDVAARIVAQCDGARDLTGRTDLFDIAALARAAAGAVGNDTGPMHLIAAAGCPSVVLFSAESDPSLTAPQGASVAVLRREDLADLPLAELAEVLILR